MKTVKNLIKKFVKDITKANKGEALDGDETENIACFIQVELDLNNGNITQAEFDEQVKECERK